MAKRPLVLSARPQVLGAGTGTGTTCTAGSSNAKGSYATLGTLNFPTSSICVSLSPGTSARRFRVDIAINSGGADTVVCEDLYCESGGAQGDQVVPYFFPLALPSGASVKARCACSTNAGVATVLVTAYPLSQGHRPGGSKIISLTDYTAEDPSNTVTLNGTTQTAWAAIAASTAKRVSRLWLVPTNIGDVSRSLTKILVDIGIGGSGSEVMIAQFLWSSSGATAFMAPQVLPYDLPAATRLSFRAQASAANTDSFGMTAFGLAA